MNRWLFIMRAMAKLILHGELSRSRRGERSAAMHLGGMR